MDYSKQCEAMAKAMFLVENENRNWDTDIAQHEKDDWLKLAYAAECAIVPETPPAQPAEKAAEKAMDYKPPFARKK